MSYPTIDPHPVGSLTAGAENYQKRILYTTGAYNVAQRATSTHTHVCAWGAYVYYTYVDISRRPHIVKVNISSGTADDQYIDSGADYVIRNDPHYMFSVAVDRLGYIHIAGDMENHSRTSQNSIAKVARYAGSDIMYWRSYSPEDHTSFEFLGYNSPYAPTGWYHGYPQFKLDMNGVVYFKSRIHVHEDSTFNEGARGINVQRYDETTRTWTPLGGLNPPVHGHTPVHKTVFWEDNAEAWASPPYPITPDSLAFYQGFYNGFEFDLDNVMHFCFPINNYTSHKHSTEVVYWKSLDGGDTFMRADGTVINGPVRASGSGDAGDIVGPDGHYSDTASVSVDWGGNPVVVFSAYVDQNSSSPTTPPYTRIRRNGTWESRISMPLVRSAGSWVGSGNDGIINYCAINTTPSQAEIYRTRRYGETGYTIDIGAAMGGMDWRCYKKFGRLYAAVSDGTAQSDANNDTFIEMTDGHQMLIELTFTDQVFDDPSRATSAGSVSKKMLMV